MAERAESPQVAVRPVSFIAASIVVFLFAAVGMLALSFPGAISRGEPPNPSFPEPSVQTDERAQRLTLEKVQRERLSGKNGGIAIDEAMEMIVERGARAYDPVTGLAP